jgi:hypothetical protein
MSGWGDAPSLRVIDSVISDNLVAGVWLSGEGNYQLSGNTITGGIGVPHGSTTRCGDGVFARGVAAWDGTSGLLLDGNTLTGNAGAGLLLDDASAMLGGNTWTGNAPDLWVQGDACLSPRDDWAEAPTSEVCPEWDRPTCDLAFSLTLMIVDATPSLPPPPLLPLHPLTPPRRLSLPSARAILSVPRLQTFSLPSPSTVEGR